MLQGSTCFWVRVLSVRQDKLEFCDHQGRVYTVTVLNGSLCYSRVSNEKPRSMPVHMEECPSLSGYERWERMKQAKLPAFQRVAPSQPNKDGVL